MLVVIWGETDLSIQDPTKRSQWIQDWIDDRVLTIGDERVNVPSTNPNLFLAINAFRIEHSQVG